jgi:uncharacterized protein DUF3617
MNRVLIGVPALALAGACIAGAAQALPAGPPRAAIAAVRSAPVLPARAHSRYRDAADPAPLSAPAAADPGGVKPGQWEFTTRLDGLATPRPQAGAQPPQPAQPLSGGGATYLSCIQSDRPVPFQFDGAQCKLDSRERQGPRITWSMICTNPQGAVRSDGVAQYRGDTMEGTLINHFPAANGAITDLTQRITGRYLGPCPQMAQAAVTPSRPNASPDAAAGSSSQWVEPPAASGGAQPSAAQPHAAPERAAPSTVVTAAPAAAQPPTASGAATPSTASSQDAATAEPRPPPRIRYAHHRRHYYRRYYGYSGGAWPGGGLFGIRIPFLGGL